MHEGRGEILKVRRRPIHRAIALLTAAVLVAPFGTPSASGAGCSAVTTKGSWTTVKKPRFPHGPQAISDHEAQTGERLLVTNGVSVMTTADGGCSWREDFFLPDSAAGQFPSSAGASIDQIEILGIKGGRIRVALVVPEDATLTDRPHVIVGSLPRSSNGAGTWAMGDGGLPGAGTPEFLTPAPSDPDIAYLGIDVGGGSIDLLYATGDGGSSWQLRSDLTTLQAPPAINTLEVDPLKPDHLWAAGATGLYRSTNGGRSFTSINEFFAAPAGPIDLFHEPGSPAQIVVFRPASTDFLASVDGGQVWLGLGSPGPVGSIAHGTRAADSVISSVGRVWIFHAASFTWLDLVSPVKDLTDLQSTSEPTFQGRTPDRLAIYRNPGVSDVSTDVGGTDINADFGFGDGPKTGSPSISPGRSRVVVGLGQSRSVNYKLQLPRQNVPLDLIFLLDTTNSMTRFTEGLVEAYAGIINGLTAAGLDVDYGLAEHRAYPDTLVPRSPEPNFVYRKVLDRGATEGQLRAALEGLQHEAGGRFDAQTGALEQLAIGSGVDMAPPGPSGNDVPRGQQINFRAVTNQLRIVILGTDEAFGEAGEERDGVVVDQGTIVPPDIPTIDEIVPSLNERNIHVIGIAVGSDPLNDLKEVAGKTGAVAPTGGVDCNGDRAIDIPTGGELVCKLSHRNLRQADNLVPAIVNLVQAVRTRTAVRLGVGEGNRVVKRITPSRHAGVVLQTANTLDFKVTYACGLADVGKRVRVELDAISDSKTLDSAVTTVVCSDRPEFTGFGVLIPLVVALLPPPPPPPPGVTELASQINAQQQVNAQAAAAGQKQEQHQLAYAYRRQTESQQALAEEQEYQMSRYRPRGEQVDPMLPLGAATILMGLAYGVAVRTRERIRPQRANRY